MARRTLPEHTVDIWLAHAILTRFPRALLWAPTQSRPDNWDQALAVAGDAKAVLFECKATDPIRRTGGHSLTIDRRQLTTNIGLGPDPRPPAPVFYVLPSPPWRAPSGGASISPVPSEASCRLPTPQCGRPHAQPHGTFACWTTVIRADRLASGLGPGPYTRPATWFAGQRGARSLSVFLEELAQCDAVPLTPKGFAPRWDEEEALAPLDDRPAKQPSQGRERGERRGGNRVATVIPATDLEPVRRAS
jgi:hypothetical protein